MAAVPSVEPSSTTTTSSGGRVWPRIESTASAIHCSDWYAASTAEISGLDVFVMSLDKRIPRRRSCERKHLRVPGVGLAMKPSHNGQDRAGTPPGWSSLDGERMLVTGGAGTIGSTLVDQLIESGAAEVVVLDNFVRGRRQNLEWAQVNGNLTVVEGDVRDRELVSELSEGIDVVFHQAAIRITQCAEEP